MATYAIGDLHGCAKTFADLGRKLPFDEKRDHLWLTGDLVNKGPGNAGLLRWSKTMSGKMGERFRVVLGNHDLHLLGRAAGFRDERASDSLDDVLDAPDRDELVDWLRCQPLAVESEIAGRRTVMVHAGVVPDWTTDRTLELAAEASEKLAGDKWEKLLRRSLDEPPKRWSEDLSGSERRAFVLSTVTRLRTLRKDGTACVDFSGPPDEAPKGCVPWFSAPGRKSTDTLFVTGHWAALGLRMNREIVALDTACVWGGLLTAVRLDDGQVWQVELQEPTTPTLDAWEKRLNFYPRKI